jgi:DNA-binding response OmpR family regulator
MIKRSLLVVDDDRAVREAITRVLEAEDYNVSSAACSKDAFRHFSEKKIDIVLLDLSLGQEQGWEIFHALRKCQRDLPIIVISARADELAHSSVNDASGVLEKPFDVPLLLNLLKRFSEPVTVAKT